MSVIQNDYFELAADTTPQLGGDLDGNGHSIEDAPIGTVTPSEGNFTDLEVTGEVQSDMDFGGNYALQLQNIPDLASKGAGYWFDGVNDDIEIKYSTKFAGLVDCGFSIVSFVNIESLPVNEAAIINYSYFVGSTYGLFIGTAGGVNMTIRGATTSKSVSGGVLELNRNYVIVGVYDPDADSRIHVNEDMTTDDMSGHGYSETARAIVIGRGGVWGTPGYLNCATPKNLLFNTVLTKAEADAFSNNAPIPYKYLDASQTALTAGALIPGKQYTIDTFVAGDDFVNVGGENVTGSIFVATGTTPTTWTNSSSLRHIGCVLQLEQNGIGHKQWLGNSGDTHGEVDGALPINLSPNHVEKYIHMTSITDDTAWTDVVPAGYILNYIIFEGENANDATIDLGTTSGASDVFSQEVIAGDDITVVAINKMFSKTAAQSLYLNDDGAGSWNSASLLATLCMSKVEV